MVRKICIAILKSRRLFIKLGFKTEAEEMLYLYSDSRQ